MNGACSRNSAHFGITSQFLSDCCDFFLQNKQFLGQNVKLASLKAPPVCDHVTQGHLIHFDSFDFHHSQMSLLEAARTAQKQVGPRFCLVFTDAMSIPQ